MHNEITVKDRNMQIEVRIFSFFACFFFKQIYQLSISQRGSIPIQNTKLFNSVDISDQISMSSAILFSFLNYMIDDLVLSQFLLSVKFSRIPSLTSSVMAFMVNTGDVYNFISAGGFASMIKP